MPGGLEAAEALGVHVQQLARARPLVAHDRWPLGRRGPRAPAAPEHLMDSGVRAADVGGDPPRAPARAPAQRTDPGLLGGRHPRGAGLRAAGAIGQAGQRGALLGRGGPPAARPLPHRRLRDVGPGGRLGQRFTVLNDTTHDLPPPQRRVAGSMVRHFRASLRDVSSHPHPLGRTGPNPSPRSERPWARHLGLMRQPASARIAVTKGSSGGRTTPPPMTPTPASRWAIPVSISGRTPVSTTLRTSMPTGVPRKPRAGIRKWSLSAQVMSYIVRVARTASSALVPM